MDLSIGDRVFYTRSNGLRPPATVVGTAEDGPLHLEYYQDGLRVVNRQCKMESISFAIPSSDSPPNCRCLSPLPNTQSSSPPKGPWSFTMPQEPGMSPSTSPPVQFGSPNSKGVSVSGVSGCSLVVRQANDVACGPYQGLLDDGIVWMFGGTCPL